MRWRVGWWWKGKGRGPAPLPVKPTHVQLAVESLRSRALGAQAAQAQALGAGRYAILVARVSPYSSAGASRLGGQLRRRRARRTVRHRPMPPAATVGHAPAHMRQPVPRCRCRTVRRAQSLSGRRTEMGVPDPAAAGRALSASKGGARTPCVTARRVFLGPWRGEGSLLEPAAASPRRRRGCPGAIPPTSNSSAHAPRKSTRRLVEMGSWVAVEAPLCHEWMDALQRPGGLERLAGWWMAAPTTLPVLWVLTLSTITRGAGT